MRGNVGAFHALQKGEQCHITEGRPCFPPGKTLSANAQFASAASFSRCVCIFLRMETAGGDNGTRCSLPALMRLAGIVHAAFFRSISSHRAYNLARACRREDQELERESRRALLFTQRAYECPNLGERQCGMMFDLPDLATRGSRFSMWPRQRAGFSPVRYSRVLETFWKMILRLGGGRDSRC